MQVAIVTIILFGSALVSRTSKEPLNATYIKQLNIEYDRLLLRIQLHIQMV